MMPLIEGRDRVKFETLSPGDYHAWIDLAREVVPTDRDGRTSG